jgi:SAM-dependent methyltransferase
MRDRQRIIPTIAVPVQSGERDAHPGAGSREKSLGSPTLAFNKDTQLGCVFVQMHRRRKRCDKRSLTEYGFPIKALGAHVSLKGKLRPLVERTTLGYRLILARDRRAIHRPARPHAPWHNAVLQTELERDYAVDQIRSLGLPVMQDRAKNWDSLAALDCILNNTTPRARVLDAGAELYSVILPWLFLYGYRRLQAINLVFDKPARRGPIVYEYGDITRTQYPPASFDAITCLSVVEHGVDPGAWLTEMSRILKPGGILFTSTDYWETSIDTGGRTAYGVPVRIFSRADVQGILQTAESAGLQPTGPPSFACKDRVVHWQKVALDFTFISFALRKGPAVTSAQVQLKQRLDAPLPPPAGETWNSG